MGCTDIFCAICGAPYHDLRMYELQIRNMQKWLKKCVLLLPNGDIRRNCQEQACYGEFVDKKGYSFVGSILKSNSQGFFDGSLGQSMNGIFIHEDCYKYVQKTRGIKLRYNDFPCIVDQLNKKSEYNCFNVSYGNIEKYWMQDFDVITMFNDKNHFMIESPLKNEKNAKRIDKVLNQLKIKRKDDRKSPNISATFFKEGDIKLGNDYNFHIIKNGKWMLYQKPVAKIIDFHLEEFNKNASKVMINYVNNMNFTCDTFRSKLKTNRYNGPLFIHIKNHEQYYDSIKKPSAKRVLMRLVIFGTDKSISKFLKDLPKNSYTEI